MLGEHHEETDTEGLAQRIADVARHLRVYDLHDTQAVLSLLLGNAEQMRERLHIVTELACALYETLLTADEMVN